jgi:hypothetical protein
MACKRACPDLDDTLSPPASPGLPPCKTADSSPQPRAATSETADSSQQPRAAIAAAKHAAYLASAPRGASSTMCRPRPPRPTLSSGTSASRTWPRTTSSAATAARWASQLSPQRTRPPTSPTRSPLPALCAHLPPPHQLLYRQRQRGQPRQSHAPRARLPDPRQLPQAGERGN